MLKRSGLLIMLSGLLACGQAGSGAAEDLTGPFSGRGFPIPGNPFVGEVVSDRRADGDIHHAKVLMFANLPEPENARAVAVVGYDVEIDCRRQAYRRVYQTSYSREGRVIDGLSLENDFLPAGGLAKFLAEVCSGAPMSADDISFATVEEFAQLAQARIRHIDLGRPTIALPDQGASQP